MSEHVRSALVGLVVGGVIFGFTALLGLGPVASLLVAAAIAFIVLFMIEVVRRKRAKERFTPSSRESIGMTKFYESRAMTAPLVTPDALDELISAGDRLRMSTPAAIEVDLFNRDLDDWIALSEEWLRSHLGTEAAQRFHEEVLPPHEAIASSDHYARLLRVLDRGLAQLRSDRERITQVLGSIEEQVEWTRALLSESPTPDEYDAWQDRAGGPVHEIGKVADVVQSLSPSLADYLRGYKNEPVGEIPETVNSEEAGWKGALTRVRIRLERVAGQLNPPRATDGR